MALEEVAAAQETTSGGPGNPKVPSSATEVGVLGKHAAPAGRNGPCISDSDSRWRDLEGITTSDSEVRYST